MIKIATRQSAESKPAPKGNEDLSALMQAVTQTQKALQELAQKSPAKTMVADIERDASSGKMTRVIIRIQ